MSIENLTFIEKTASVEEIYAHLNSCRGNYEPPLNEKVDIMEYSKKLFEYSVTFEAWANKSLVGLIAAYLNDVIGRSGYITNVSVTKDFMDKGIASVLMKMCLEKALKENFNEIMVEIFKGNLQAIKLYHKFGFQEFQCKGDSTFMRLFLTKKEFNE